ncbi:uncharacterized protein LY89DRAFT_313594 [Mollisia scopiformis]|uniref:RelA/SpoT domain-containing protein n=1 Tax=Mollisia scopiformis TaxID=149040 RepID=A0A194XRS7_MOLSC|nr:uncharacterized protein LY89DRAFT_313594 [Mollisia scopiformis]KUJ22898.1 hypothetical protein LY89DRAFT_313594 [Mollisia scopiformis]
METDSLSVFESSNRIDNSADVIGSFIADWVQIKYFYSEAASLAQELCETLLASNAIRAIVTHRVKQGHRLEAKLRERVRKLGREYKTAREIRDDVVDLAGVRIALYFPSDREKIDKIIHDAFTEVKHKTFPEQDSNRVSDSMSLVTETSLDFQQRFHGYSADHYRVRMRVENLATKKLRDDFQKTNPVIEIQVASVLMHAWAEIDHDLVYKTLTSGPASQQELRLLDATNGLVHTGEVLLQQLQTAMDDRVAYQNKPFSEQYELLSFLRGQIKKAKGSMEHLDILLLVLKITDLDSPRKLGEILEGFMIPPKSNAPIALIILEHILCSLGEDQRRNNNLYLRPRSVVLRELEIDKTNSKCYSTDVSTRDKILDQRDILEMAVSVADIMRFPEKSILVVEGMPQKFRKFYALYNLVHFATIRPDKESKEGEKWLCEISLRELDPLWTWFETNEDVLFRVSLLLARMNVEEVDQELIKLRPSSGFQRLPSVYEPNAGYLSPRHISPGNMSPGYFSSGSLNRGDDNTDSRVSRTPEGSRSPTTSPIPGNQSKNQRPERGSPAARATPQNFDTDEENEEDDSPVVIPERTRRPYIESTSRPESENRLDRDKGAPIESRAEKHRNEAERSPEHENVTPTPGKRRYASERVPQMDFISTRSMPEARVEREEFMNDQPRLTSRGPNRNAYVEEESSDGSDAEPRNPMVRVHQQSGRQSYRPSSQLPQPRTKRRESYHATSSPGEYTMPEVPEVPEPPDLEQDPERVAEPRYRGQSSASMTSMPVAAAPTKPKRRDTGRSRRNDYYRSNEPALRRRFEPLGGRARSMEEPAPSFSGPPAYFPTDYREPQPQRPQAPRLSTYYPVSAPSGPPGSGW